MGTVHLNTTDMHPFVNAFTPANPPPPPWQTRTDFDVFHTLAEVFNEQARIHLGTRTDLVASPLAHDTLDELSPARHGRRRAGGRRPVPGVNFPKLAPVARDCTAVAERMRALGPLSDSLGATTKGVT